MSVIDKTKATADVGTTLGPWLIKHREAVSLPLIEGFVKTVQRTPGTNKVGAIGAFALHLSLVERMWC